MKIDKKTRAELTKLAEALPRIQETDPQGNPRYRFGTFKQKGKALLEANPKMKDADGSPLNPEKFYKVKLPVWVNHTVSIMHAYREGGQPEVEKYCAIMMKAYRLHQKMKRNPFYRVSQFMREIKKAINA